MKNILKKVIVICILLILAFSVFNIEVLAENPFDREGFNVTDAGKAGEATQKMFQTALAITKVITTGIAMIMLVVLGIKYVMASAGDRAEIKKHAVVYVIGAIVMFGATGIITIIEGFASSLE